MAQKEDKEVCPYKSCGRRFVSDAQLKNHIERRHKIKIEEPPKKSENDPQLQKVPESYASFKGKSTKLGQMKKTEAIEDVHSELTFSQTFDTPIH